MPCPGGHQRGRAANGLHDLQARVAKQEAARAQATAADLENANQTRKLAAGTVDRSNRDDVDGLRRVTPGSTPPPEVVGCPAPPPTPASLRQAGERLKTQEDYSLRAQRNIRQWREKLNETSSTSIPE
jgi:hypothetical protein